MDKINHNTKYFFLKRKKIPIKDEKKRHELNLILLTERNSDAPFSSNKGSLTALHMLYIAPDYNP